MKKVKALMMIMKDRGVIILQSGAQDLERGPGLLALWPGLEAPNESCGPHDLIRGIGFGILANHMRF